jgi:hypothetical protein
MEKSAVDGTSQRLRRGTGGLLHRLGSFLPFSFRFGAGMLIKSNNYEHLFQREECGMKKDCVYMNKCYRHGSALELTGENLLCNDGEWKKDLDQPKDRKTKALGKDM